MENLALGNDTIVNLGAMTVRYLHRRASESSEQIFDEMELQEIVDEENITNQESNQVVPNGDDGERVEQETVGTSRRTGVCRNGGQAIHRGRTEAKLRSFSIVIIGFTSETMIQREFWFSVQRFGDFWV